MRAIPLLLLLATSASLAPHAIGQNDPEHERLARGAAGDLPWVFSGADALAEAKELDRPILAYVRCTDHREALDSLRSSIDGSACRFHDDGYAKDVLFRAGPLSDPDVADLIETRFVPVCLTYILAENQGRSELPPGWGHTGMAGAEFRVDADEGCLVITKGEEENKTPDNWFAAVTWDPEKAATLELSARVRTSDFGKGSEACVMVQCWSGQKALAYGRCPEIRKDKKWDEVEARFDVPKGVDTIRLLAYLVGEGEVRFDDLTIRELDDDAPNLLENGDLSRVDPEGPFGGLAIDAKTTTTPALVVLDREGKLVRRLHRFGAVSGDLVDRWLRGTLDELDLDLDEAEPAELYRQGRLDELLAATKSSKDSDTRILRARAHVRQGDLAAATKELPPKAPRESVAEAEVVRGFVAMREGQWKDAVTAFTVSLEDDGGREDARFLRAWSRKRLGEHELADEDWRAVVGDTAYGRKAATSLLRFGPRPTLAITYRAWPLTDELPEETERRSPGPFDADHAITLLLELQNSDGSFGEHVGMEGHTWSTAAITGLCVDALEAWSKKKKGDARDVLETARERGLEFLEQWSESDYVDGLGSQAFNNAYSLMTLAANDREEAAASVVKRIETSQLPDGNWTVYHEKRPASFNTALCVLALLDAKEAGVEIPEDVLESGIDALEVMRQEGDLFPYSTGTGHEWMTTVHGAIARDPLCEYTLLRVGRGSRDQLEAALERYWRHGHELRVPTKRLYDYFNSRGHGGYYFFFAHWNARVAAETYAKGSVKRKAIAFARDAVLSAQEGDGSYVDKFLLGRAYGTGMALLVLADDIR